MCRWIPHPPSARCMHVCAYVCAWPSTLPVTPIVLERIPTASPFGLIASSCGFSSPDILSLLFLRLCFLNPPCRSSTSNLEGLTVAQKTGMMPLRRASVVKTSGFLPEPAAQISISSASSRPRRSKACQFFKAFLLIHFVMYAAGGGYQGGLSCLYDIRHAFTKSYLL